MRGTEATMPHRHLSDLPAESALPLGERPFLPTTLDEARARGWDALDVVLVSGDAYVDHVSFAAAVIGRVLEAAGWQVGILPQPDWRDAEPFRALGRPRLFFGITAGNMDSMVNHYTAHKRRRSEDAYSPDGRAGMRPDRCSIVYAQRCREAFRDVPVVLGGVEASLRRLAHYDWWDDAVRRSILLDAKADLLVFGQGEKTVLSIADRLSRGERPADLFDLPGIALARKSADGLAAAWGREVVVLPSFEEVRDDRPAFARFSRACRLEHAPENARVLVQPHGDRVVVVLPPAPNPTTEELDRVFALPFARSPHPRYRGERLPAFEQIQHSVQLMRGCPAGCAFCCITEHQGRDVCSRSEASVLREIAELAAWPGFRGTVTDLGGPTANLWGAACQDPRAHAACRRASCVQPTLCKRLRLDHRPLTALYRKARAVPGVRHAFVASGVRYDLAHADRLGGEAYLKELIAHHVSGQLKVAPEHVAPAVLRRIGKPPVESFDRFREEFERFSREAGKEQYLVPYFISSLPGCTLEEAAELHDYLRAHGWKPRQVQDFMPTPMTLSTDMFHTGLDPRNLEPVAVARGVDEKRMQKALMCWADPELRPWYERAMARLGRARRRR